MLQDMYARYANIAISGEGNVATIYYTMYKLIFKLSGNSTGHLLD